MRLAALPLVFAVAAGSQTVAQTAAPPPAPPPTAAPTPAPAGTPEQPTAAPAPAATAATATSPAPQPTTTTAAPAAAATTPPATPTPAAPPPATAAAPAAPPAAAPETPAPAPEAPPAAPTDPVAIALLDTLQSVCVPAVKGGNLASLTKTAGYRKTGDNFVYKGKGFQLTVESPGSNPNQCHVDIIHPADPAAPAQTMVIALHNWAAIDRDYSLYRNDKNVSGSVEYTTRSWEHTADGKHQALVITTMRKADGSPAKGASDTSQMIFSEIPAT